jgi:hypothetical protein
MKQFSLLAIFVVVFLFSATWIFAKKVDTKTIVPSTEITDKTYIHYSNQYCKECHQKIPKKDATDTLLKYDGNFTQLCKCHGYTAGTYIHPVDVVPSPEKKAMIPDSFPLHNGKITCNTCHDMYAQCQETEKSASYRKRTMFLRGAPFKKRTELCFKCHDEKKYKLLDPHNQLRENGDIIVEKCLYCHVEKPDEKKAAFKDVKLVGDLKVLCARCHGDLVKHPGNAFHFGKPRDKTLTRMKLLEVLYDTILPLDYEGKMTCATCHNPHERGVIPADRAGATGASEHFRHRLPPDMCKKCHGF